MVQSKGLFGYAIIIIIIIGYYKLIQPFWQ